MKAKTRNYSVCALVAVVLLAMAVLVTGCPAEPGTEAGYQPPADKGAVHLNFGKSIARATILPRNTTIDDFTAIELVFEGTVPANDKTVEISPNTSANRAVPILLEPDDYTLSVVAYLGPGKTNPAAAASTATGGGVLPILIVVDEGKNTNIDITLRAYSPADAEAGDTGKFTWEIADGGITFEDDISAEMVITEIGGPFTLTIDLVDTDWESGSIDLTPGYYYVDFTLIVDSGTPKTFRHILHIYYNMESIFSYTFTNDDIAILTSRVTASTFEFKSPEDDEIALVLYHGLVPIVEGGEITLSIDAEDTAEIIIDNADSYDSFAWYCGDLSSPLETADSFTVDVADPPFDEVGIYRLSIIAITEDGVPYSSYLVINVVE
jgi:hypothetical protein